METLVLVCTTKDHQPLHHVFPLCFSMCACVHVSTSLLSQKRGVTMCFTISSIVSEVHQVQEHMNSFRLNCVEPLIHHTTVTHILLARIFGTVLARMAYIDIRCGYQLGMKIDDDVFFCMCTSYQNTDFCVHWVTD